MKEVVIASACRTPIAKFQGGLQGFRAPELGALAIREALRRARVAPDQVEEVIFGNVLQAGLGQNPARQAARGAGLPEAGWPAAPSASWHAAQIGWRPIRARQLRRSSSSCSMWS